MFSEGNNKNFPFWVLLCILPTFLAGCSVVPRYSLTARERLLPAINPEQLPTSTPESPQAKTPAPIRMLFVGDIMLDRNVKKRITTHGQPYILEPLAASGFFSGYDVIHGNLEGPIADKRRPTTKSIAFRFDPKDLDILTHAGFNIVNLANNHTLDMGKRGVEETKKYLDNAGVGWYGSEYAIDRQSLLYKTINEQTFAFIGLNATHTAVSTTLVSPLLQEAREKANYTIVNIHWGEEYHEISNDTQQELAHWLVDNGADAIIGHHPHVVEEVEIYRDKPIFYSLGNFVFDQYFSVQTQQGLAVGMTFIPHRALKFQLHFLESNDSQVSHRDLESASTTARILLEHSRLGDYTMNTSTYALELPLQ